MHTFHNNFTPPEKKSKMSFIRPKPPQTVILLLTYASLFFLISPANAIICSSQKFSNNLYTNCTDLPTLNSSLHWTHVANTSSISIAFVAPPSKPDGWIAWAINPTGTGMAGSQALLAFKDSNGSMTVKTYNISSYSSIVEGKIAFEVSDSRAEFSAGSMKIYATLKLPKTMTEVNHVWQVGGSVMGGMPVKHEFQPENLNAKGILKIQSPQKAKTSGAPAPSPAIAPSPNTSPTGSSTSTSSSPTGSSRPTSSSATKNNVMCLFFMVIIGALMLN
ncbi:hypothetical protein QVD17_17350 [Tagetes erecta]|uniref:DOMON domain-containing protein n=1 Tax=Tagetes erecta TaxID=13708 RepID=A0AAD8KZC0_TARER|nr:hypothetical protein QVD17_17350 [Tagetes erecta]